MLHLNRLFKFGPTLGIPKRIFEDDIVQLHPASLEGDFFSRVISICHISLKSPFYADFNDTNLNVFFDPSQISQSKLSIPKILESHWLIWEASKKTLRLVSLKSA